MRATHIPARCVQEGDIFSAGGERVLNIRPGPGNCVRIFTTETTKTKAAWTPECGKWAGPYVEHRDNPVVVYI